MNQINRNLDKIVIAIPEVAKGQSFVGASLPPLGATRIAKMARARYPDLEVEVLDGVQIGQDQLRSRVRELSGKSLLGISAHTSLNWTNCLEIIEDSPTDKILVGGIHAEGDRCGKYIAQNRGLDVIQGQGELALIQYVEYISGKRKKEEVDNLIYLDKSGGLKENKISRQSQEFFPFVDYESFLDVSDYSRVFRSQFLTGDIGFTMVSPEGCKWQDMNKKRGGYCLFCDIGTEYSLHDPRFFGRWIEDHVKRYGHHGKVFMVNYADETTGAGLGWWSDVLSNMPKNIKPHEDYGIKIYTKSGKGFFNSDNLADVFWRLGVEDIHIGFEAVTDEDLRSLHKGSTVKHHERVIEIAKNYGFRIIGSFVLGAPSATKKSLEGCISFVDRMKESLGDKVAVVTGSPLLPLPGSPSWKMLRQEAYHRGKHLDLFETDNPDLYQARRLWYDWFCDKLCIECGGVDSALGYVKEISDQLNCMGSLPTPENQFG